MYELFAIIVLLIGLAMIAAGVRMRVLRRRPKFEPVVFELPPLSELPTLPPGCTYLEEPLPRRFFVWCGDYDLTHADILELEDIPRLNSEYKCPSTGVDHSFCLYTAKSIDVQRKASDGFEVQVRYS